jgi:hypothetical protein
MSKVSVGYFIRGAIKDVDSVHGKTFSAYEHQLFPSRARAETVLKTLQANKTLDRRFTYDVCEAFMEVEDE